MIFAIARCWARLMGVPNYTGDPVGASAARKQSLSALTDEHQKLLTSTEVAFRMRTLREKNHFAELIAATMRKPD